MQHFTMANGNVVTYNCFPSSTTHIFQSQQSSCIYLSFEHEYAYNKNSNFFFSNFLNNPCWTCKKSFHSIYKVNESAIPLSMMR
jgi:hypothetical protein